MGWAFDEGRLEDNIVYLKFLLFGPYHGLYFIILECLEMTNQSNCHLCLKSQLMHMHNHFLKAVRHVCSQHYDSTI